MEKIAAVIVTYNRLELLKECLQAVQEQSKKVYSIVVVNNASTDGTTEFLETIDDARLVVKPLIQTEAVQQDFLKVFPLLHVRGLMPYGSWTTTPYLRRMRWRNWQARWIASRMQALYVARWCGLTALST